MLELYLKINAYKSKLFEKDINGHRQLLSPAYFKNELEFSDLQETFWIEKWKIQKLYNLKISYCLALTAWQRLSLHSKLWLQLIVGYGWRMIFFLLPTLSPVYDIVVLLYTSLVWFLVLKLWTELLYSIWKGLSPYFLSIAYRVLTKKKLCDTFVCDIYNKQNNEFKIRPNWLKLFLREN